jgi:hypothetical protein
VGQVGPPGESQGARVLRTAYVTATLWVCAALWGTWYEDGAFASVWATGVYRPPMYYVHLYGYHWVRDCYVPVLGLLALVGLTVNTHREVWRYPSVLACAVLGGVTWLYHFLPPIRE